jgi:hypothetical protein
MKPRTESAKKPGANGSAKPSRTRVATVTEDSNQACPRDQMIAEAAYYRAEQRGFAPGDELSDWLLAEVDIERSLGKLH